MNFSSRNLKKIEVLLKEAGYALRYEKGNFNSGYCLLRDKKIIIINKYFTDDVKYQKLLEIIQAIDIKDISELSEQSMKLWEKMFATSYLDDSIQTKNGE